MDKKKRQSGEMYKIFFQYNQEKFLLIPMSFHKNPNQTFVVPNCIITLNLGLPYTMFEECQCAGGLCQILSFAIRMNVYGLMLCPKTPLEKQPVPNQSILSALVLSVSYTYNCYVSL